MVCDGQLTPREGFKAKKRELDDFKNAIEMYEADPELNPLTVIQVDFWSAGPVREDPCV